MSLFLVTDAWRRMEKVSTPPPQEISIQATGGVDRCHADEQRPLKLIRPRKDNGRQEGQHLEDILKRGLDGGKRSSVAVLHFLLPFQYTEKGMNIDGIEVRTYILDNILRAQIKTPKPHSTQCNTNNQPRRRDNTARPRASVPGEIPPQSPSKTCHLPSQAPYPRPDNTDLPRQVWGNPRRADLENTAADTGNADKLGCVPDG